MISHWLVCVSMFVLTVLMMGLSLILIFAGFKTCCQCISEDKGANICCQWKSNECCLLFANHIVCFISSSLFGFMARYYCFGIWFAFYYCFCLCLFIFVARFAWISRWFIVRWLLDLFLGCGFCFLEVILCALYLFYFIYFGCFMCHSICGF